MTEDDNTKEYPGDLQDAKKIAKHSLLLQGNIEYRGTRGELFLTDNLPSSGRATFYPDGLLSSRHSVSVVCAII